MPELRPFRGLRYAAPEQLRDLICPPYDVISPAEQRRLHERNPANAVHLELSATEGADRPRAAAAAFERWIRQGILVPDPRPAFYVYRQDFVAPDRGRARVAGIIGALRLEPFESGRVLPHERTMPGPIEERLALMRALPVDVSPIYTIYRGGGGLAPFFETLESRPPVARFADENNVLHRLWAIDAPAEVDMIADALAPHQAVIADGHHRYETALAFARSRGGPGEGDAILAFAVDADAEDVVVLPYHRALRADVGAAELLERLERRYAAKPLDSSEEAETLLARSGADHPFVWHTRAGSLLIEVSAAEVAARTGARSGAWVSLDVVALHEAVLPEVLPGGTLELRFSVDAGEVRRLVDEEGFTAGVLLRPLEAAAVVEVARSGERMPQKASYFWPKVPTGLVFRRLS